MIVLENGKPKLYEWSEDQKCFRPVDRKDRSRPPTKTKYRSARDAYEVISKLPLVAVELISRGQFPEFFESSLDANVVPSDWPSDLGDPPMQMVRAAREYLSACDKGSPGELNNRMDGPVAQRVDVTGNGFIQLMAGVAAPAAALRERVEAEVELFGPARVAE